jgi:hypothetical protein
MRLIAVSPNFQRIDRSFQTAARARPARPEGDIASGVSFGHPLDPAAEHVPVEVEDRLSAARPDVYEHAIVLEPGLTGGLGDEIEHALRLLGWELGHVLECVDVALREDEEVRLGLRVDVADRDEPVALADVVALADEPAEEAVVVRQRGSPPP